MASQQPVRFVGLLAADKTATPLAVSTADALVKDRDTVAFSARGLQRALQEVRSGKVIAYSSSRMNDLSKLAEITSQHARSYLIKVGEVPDDKVNATGFAKVLTVKTDAEATKVVADLTEELFGKNAAPVVIQERKNLAELTIYGECSGEASEEALRKAFEGFGKIEKVVFPSKTSCKVLFETKEAASAALAKKEVTAGTVTVKISERQPERPKKEKTEKAEKTEKPADAKKTDGKKTETKKEQSPKMYMKIENLPEDLKGPAIKELYSKFGAQVVEVNSSQKYCILRFAKPEDYAAVLKEKVVGPNGAELVAQPYFPKGSAKKAAKGASNGTATASKATPREKTTKPAASTGPVSYRCLIDDADPAKVTPEQLETLFKGFKGFVSLSRTKSDASKYTAKYDNEAAVQEILKVKDITCGTAKLSVRAGGPTTASSPRKPRAEVHRAFILAPAAEVTVEQVLPLAQSLDKDIKIEKGTRSGDLILAFSSDATRTAALGKELKVGSHTLKVEARSTPLKPAEFGAYLPRVRRGSYRALGEVLKPIVEFEALRFVRGGLIVVLKSAKDEEKLLAASVTLNGDAPIKPEPLKKKTAAPSS